MTSILDPTTSTAPTGITHFDLESEAFKLIDNVVLAALAERVALGDPVRIWVPACGDGTAAYALTCALLERTGYGIAPSQLRVFATDKDPENVRLASLGRLPRSAVGTLKESSRHRALTWRGDHWAVSLNVRNRIVFSVQDYARSAGFALLDLVYARDVKREGPSACSDCSAMMMARSLTPGGFIIASPDMYPIATRQGLETIDMAHGIFRKQAKSVVLSGPWRTVSRPTSSPVPAVLERAVGNLAPSALVVDGGGRVVATTGDADKALLTVTNPLGASLATATKLPVRSALLNAFVAAQRGGCTMGEGDGAKPKASAQSLAPTALSDEPLWLVQLRGDSHTGEMERLSLREQLRHTTETLSRTMDELAARTLSLRHANDELQTSLDELEGTDGRLTTINAELIAVRDDYNQQSAAIASLNLDFENVLRAADMVVVILDPSGRIRRYTPAAARVFDLVEDDVGGRLAEVLSEPMSTVLEAVAAVAGGVPHRTFSLALSGADDMTAGLGHVRAYPDEAGDMAGILVSLADISELQAAQNRLEQQNVALMRANEDLERFAYIASHDLKSPLRSVRTMLEFLRSDLEATLTDENILHLNLVADRVGQMEQMIQDLLAYSRLGREASAPTTVSVAELARGQIDLLPVPDGFTIEIAADLPTLTVDAGLLAHVVRNLFDNAVKHHDRADGRVCLRCVERKPVPVFEVTDDGPGIPRRHHERIFEIFQKGGGRVEAAGSGMGLALVKKAVARNGGTISVHSEDGCRGTTFRFSWPERETATN